MAEDWTSRYNKACDELKEAEAQWKFADSQLAVANARFADARRKLGRLYSEREKMINA